MSYNQAVSQVVDGKFNYSSAVVVLPATGTTTISSSQSGTIFSLPQATANTIINLPAVAAGLNFKFVVAATADGAHTQTITATAGTPIIGLLLGLTAGFNTAKAAAISLVLSATAANVKVGDYAQLTCDGTNWSVQAFSSETACGWS